MPAVLVGVERGLEGEPSLAFAAAFLVGLGLALWIAVLARLRRGALPRSRERRASGG